MNSKDENTIIINIIDVKDKKKQMFYLVLNIYFHIYYIYI